MSGPKSRYTPVFDVGQPREGTNAPDNLAAMARAWERVAEACVAANLQHPTLDLFLASERDGENAYANRAIRRVVDLRRSGEVGARVRIVGGRPDDDGRHVFFLCVVERADGTLHDPDDRIVDPARVLRLDEPWREP